MPDDPTPALLYRMNQNIMALGSALEEIGIWIALTVFVMPSLAWPANFCPSFPAFLSRCSDNARTSWKIAIPLLPFTSRLNVNFVQL
ncbi:hypothetical protein T3H00_28120 [Pseudomonas fluorescens]|jgi:hypothetical protein|uniref:hypothetical protein n=1 Tax=Pseudomonas fluorescens TaxID=294 RepID=UPI002ACAFE7F|nr:hypothetical protein [Pseudomonas fluorescens]MDZ5436519.1 hypothetical protein [Pseudomonas fluorescens]